jgi:hypothetical protein
MLRIAMLVLILVISAPALFSSHAAQSPLAGRWDLTVQGTDSVYPSWLEVTAGAGGQLTGRFVGHFGSVRPIIKLEFSSGNLMFSLPPQFEHQKNDLVFKGKLAGGKLTGTSESEDGKPISWTGVRAPELKTPSNPQWGQPITLFNGKDLTGWKLRSEKSPGCFSIDQGSMTNAVPCVDIISDQKFKDFKLHLEFRILAESNSGVYLRGRYEVQIQDDFGKPTESHNMGGVYGFLAPTTNQSKKAGEWQSYDITLVGRQVTVVQDGKTIIDRQEIPGITGGALDSAQGTPGPLMLQGDHGKVWFKNVVITPAK